MKLLRWLLLPFVPVYDLFTRIRNFAYTHDWLNSKTYYLPIIAVGNLSVGGTGKTPMIEYLIRLLREEFRIATLSRGYGRKTTGFIKANERITALDIGDEPYQFFSKFKDIIVAVDENRVNGIERLLNEKIPPEVILLDDAFQHRKVTAGLYILLTVYDDLYVDDILLPTGNLRESKIGAKRADIIVVTKSPGNLSEQAKTEVIKKLQPENDQLVFFSSITYDATIYNGDKTLKIEELKKSSITVVTGIANPNSFLTHLRNLGIQFEHLAFNDHHNFTESEITQLANKNIVLTTEKDYVRIGDKLDNLWYLPISIEIDKPDLFKKAILAYSRTIL